MSKKSTVNPDHYKTAGRNPQGHDVVQSVERQRMRQEKAWLDKEAAGHEPVRRAPEKHTPAASKTGAKSTKTKAAESEQAARTKQSREESPASGVENSSPEKREAQAARAHEPKRSRSREKNSGSGEAENPERQASSKSGKRASAQKAAGRRHEWRRESEPAPASNKVAGANGREQPGREPVAAKVEEDE